MSQANVELVRAIYDRFRAGDTDGALGLQDPEIEIHDRPQAPDPQVYRGHKGVLAALRASQEAFEGLDVVPEEFLEVGERVVVVFRFQGTGRGSGVPIDEQLAHVWTVRSGKAVRVEVHSGRDEALSSAERAAAEP
jgi:ketosteroid isomerase-like protein